MRRFFEKRRDYAYEKAYAAPHPGIPRRSSRVGTTITIDLGDI
jgi:hypothetical protein